MALPQQKGHFNSNSQRKREVHEGGNDPPRTQNTLAIVLRASSCPWKGSVYFT